MYETLSLINGSFRQILQELERLQQIAGFRQRVSIKSVELAAKETQAWTLFEILEILRQREEEDEWTRCGRVRGRLEQTETVEAPRQPQTVKQAVLS